MSNNKMLIDAAHPEETRVVVLRDGRVEEFDYESAARKLLRGNIYLAKVTRVEPSLQAAFVDYGGNRHGFLAFNEIHPDYYQIPIADRELLKQEEADAEAAAEAAAEARADKRLHQQEERKARSKTRRRGGRGGRRRSATADTAAVPDMAGLSIAAQAAIAAVLLAQGKVKPQKAVSAPSANDPKIAGAVSTSSGSEPSGTELIAEPSDKPRAVGLVEDEGVHDADGRQGDGGDGLSAKADDNLHDVDVDEHDEGDDASDDDDDHGDDDNGDDTNGDDVEEVGTEDAMEEVAVRPRRRARQYKIQEVTKRRQVLLVQVVKEERGNKGAALTTYLSLAGRYTVLMPNTGRGGGISRKITNAPDRKRLKAIANELDVPEGMGLIIRTAGASRTKAEIQRDFEYLLRLWESVRELTLDSSAPNLVYEEGNLIKRSIRDLYSKEVDEILVAGERSFTQAKDFMAMLMPSHAKNVIAYKQPEPLFAKYQIERQLNAMFSPYVTLKSGGYIVINQTEALVSVDVNSGKSTREYSIEQTAVNTNLEAAEELARQLKLRDLAGLIVIDFIDMEEKRNNRAVERKIKECLKNDRARIQVGRISHFGLLEMSRQRMRTGVLEGSTTQCPHCTGTGVIRSTESVALAVLRALEDALLGNARHSLTASTTPTVALYILNHKRAFINEMEDRYGISLTVEASDAMQGANFTIEKSAVQGEPHRRTRNAAVKMEWGFENGTAEAAGSERATSTERQSNEADAESKKPRRRRRRGGRSERPDGTSSEARNPDGAASQGSNDVNGARHDQSTATQGTTQSGAEAGQETAASSAEDGGATDGDGKPRRARRRGRRGGRRNRERQQNTQDPATGQDRGQENNASADSEPAQAQDTAATSAAATRNIPGSGDQPDLGDLPALHGGAPTARTANDEGGSEGEQPAAKPARRRSRSSARAKPQDADQRTATKDGDTSPKTKPRTKPAARKAPAKRANSKTPAEEKAPADAAPPPATSKPASDKDAAGRKGWWQRAFSSD